MKRMWLGVGILVGLCAVGIALLGLNRAESSQVAALVARAQGAALREDYVQARELSLAAGTRWEACEGFFDTIVSHEETDVIGQELAQLPIYAEDSHRTEFLAACGRLLVMVSHLEEMERPRLHNIL